MKRKGVSLDKQPDPFHRVRQELEHNGFSSIPVLSNLESDYYANQLWDWLAGFGTGIKKDDPTTWTNANWPHNSHGLIQHFNSGQSKAVWEVRAKESIMDVFAKLWDCEKRDLLVSFDGINVARPVKALKHPSKKKGKKPGWEHLDQSSESNDLEYYQGCVSLTHTTGGLRFYGGSHKHHAKFMKTQTTGTIKPGWYKLNEDEKSWYLKRSGVSSDFVQSKAGQLTLWDSRTVHCGELPTTGSTPRMCIYVSYVPRDHFLRKIRNDSNRPLAARVTKLLKTESMILKKIETFEQRRMTTHKPIPVKMFSKTFQHYGHPELLERFPDQPTIRDEDVTPVMRRLIGYDE